MRRSLLRELRKLAPNRPMTFGETLRVAELQANRLLEWAGITEAAVPNRVVRRFPRVRVESVHPMPVSGATRWHDGRWQILLNAGESESRRRFSAFHELKHIIDHPIAGIGYPAFGDMTSEERREQIADYFAACLLMPRAWVKRAWSGGEQTVPELASLFQVSREAMRYRLESLGLLSKRVRCEVAA